MAEMQESWKDVASKAEALGLKLKLHLEQESDDDDDTANPGDTKAVIDDLGKRLQDTFDSLGAAVKDPAVRSDFKDIGSLFKDALTDTFSSVSTDVGDAMKKATSRMKSDETDDGTGDDTAADDSNDTAADDTAADDTATDDTTEG